MGLGPMEGVANDSATNELRRSYASRRLRVNRERAVW